MIETNLKIGMIKMNIIRVLLKVRMLSCRIIKTTRHVKNLKINKNIVFFIIIVLLEVNGEYGLNKMWNLLGFLFVWIFNKK